jgi:hypothetical protein
MGVVICEADLILIGCGIVPAVLLANAVVRLLGKRGVPITLRVEVLAQIGGHAIVYAVELAIRGALFPR